MMNVMVGTGAKEVPRQIGPDDCNGCRDAKMRTYKLVQSSTQQTAFVKFQINYLLKPREKTGVSTIENHPSHLLS